MRHSRTRTSLVAVAALTATLAGPVPLALGRSAIDGRPAALAPGLSTQLGRLPADATATVVVRLRDALDLPAASGTDRATRRAAVVRGLREQARGSQRSILARLDALARTGAVTRRIPLWVTNAVSVTATGDVVRELAARSDVAAVEPDAIEVTLAATSPEANIALTGAPTLWDAGETGDGAVVGLLDTGVDPAAADLAARWRGGTDSWYDPYGQHPDGPVDLDGHGTGTAGIVVGGTSGSGYGMAPGARWIAARVFDDRGRASATAMHQAFQWMLDPDGDATTDDAPDVVNASWALGSGPSCDLSFQPDLRALRAASIIPVVAAGNFGPGSATSASPGNYPEALSVGAVDSADAGWAWSSEGPSTCGGRTRVFPDLVAPGVSVLTADRYAGYQYLSGTSVAAPHVAGALALLLGGNPARPAETVEAALVGGAVDLGPAGPDDLFGNGRIDVVAAQATLAAQPPPPAAADFSVSAGASSLSVRRGRSGSVTVVVTVLSGTPGAVALSVAGAPTGVSTSWAGSPVTAPGSATLRLDVGKRTARGSYRLDLTGTSGSATRSTALTLVVS